MNRIPSFDEAELKKRRAAFEAQAGKARSRRQELIGLFAKKINATRDGVVWKKLPDRAFAVLLGKRSLPALEALWSDLTQGEARGYPFSALFWKEVKKPKQEKLI